MDRPRLPALLAAAALLASLLAGTLAPVAVAATSRTLLAVGDIASCGLTGDGATGALAASLPGTIATLGDTVYANGTAQQFRDCYDPTWGPVRSRTRPVPGNHDYGTPGAAPYFAYFGSRAGTAGKGWYAYDLGTWRIYALNSNCAFVGGCGAGSRQERWLRTDLAAHPRQCVLAYWHHPLFSSGAHGNDPRTRALFRALYDARAEIVLSGHDHEYERFAPQSPAGTRTTRGIRQFVVGTGGASLRPFATVRANSQVRLAGVYGILRLSLRSTSYTWAFLPTGVSAPLDSGTTSCR